MGFNDKNFMLTNEAACKLYEQIKDQPILIITVTLIQKKSLKIRFMIILLIYGLVGITINGVLCELKASPRKKSRGQLVD